MRRALILSVILAFGIAARVEKEGPYIYAVTNGTATVTRFGTSASGALSITNTLGGYPVAAIGDTAFFGYRDLTSITIPASVTTIGDYAFGFCTSLTSGFFAGNAPATGPSAFERTPATIYYRPGTTGWGPTYAGRPTAVWTDDATGAAAQPVPAPVAAPQSTAAPRAKAAAHFRTDPHPPVQCRIPPPRLPPMAAPPGVRSRSARSSRSVYRRLPPSLPGNSPFTNPRPTANSAALSDWPMPLQSSTLPRWPLSFLPFPRSPASSACDARCMSWRGSTARFFSHWCTP